MRHKVLIVHYPNFDDSMAEDQPYLRERLATFGDRYEFRWCPGEELTPEHLADIDILCGNIPAKLLIHAPKLRWHHLQSAGVNWYNDPAYYCREDIKITRAAGLYSPAIAEYIVGMLLMLGRNLDYYLHCQARHEWKRYEGRKIEMKKRNIVFLGTGDLAHEAVRLMGPLGCRIWGIQRSAGVKPGFDELLTWEDRARALAEADAIVNTLPLTDATENCVDASFWKLVKPGVNYISVGRGQTTVTEDLIAALDAGIVHSCCLDVFEKEPLSPDSPLWDRDDVVITPHSCFLSEEGEKRRVDLFCKNLEIYARGEELPHTFKFSRGY